MVALRPPRVGSTCKRVALAVALLLVFDTYSTVNSARVRSIIGNRHGLRGSSRGVSAPELDTAPAPSNASMPWVELISWKPRAWVYHNFMTEAECDHLRELAAPSMARSSVVDSATGNSVEDPIRTSYGTFLRRYQDDVVMNVEDRLAAWTHLPVEYGEDIQVLKYVDGQKYDEHWDWFEAGERKLMDMDKTNRIATVLMYLTDVDEGGETALTHGAWLDGSPATGTPSACAKTGIYAKAKKGDALLFWDLKPDGQTGDKYSMHAGCPVLKGEKWSATKWIHQGNFGDISEIMAKRRGEAHSEVVVPLADGQQQQQAAAAEDCFDADKDCTSWAEAGHCTDPQYSAYMVGDGVHQGSCRRACKVCIVCAPGDVLCQRKNDRLKRAVSKESGDVEEPPL